MVIITNSNYIFLTVRIATISASRLGHMLSKINAILYSRKTILTSFFVLSASCDWNQETDLKVSSEVDLLFCMRAQCRHF